MLIASLSLCLGWVVLKMALLKPSRLTSSLRLSAFPPSTSSLAPVVSPLSIPLHQFLYSSPAHVCDFSASSSPHLPSSLLHVRLFNSSSSCSGEDEAALPPSPGRLVGHFGDSTFFGAADEVDSRPMHEKYAAQFDKVKRVLMERNAFSRDIVEKEALTYYTRLGGRIMGEVFTVSSQWSSRFPPSSCCSPCFRLRYSVLRDFAWSLSLLVLQDSTNIIFRRLLLRPSPTISGWAQRAEAGSGANRARGGIT